MSKKLEWEESYSVGVKEIDEQHKGLFKVVNELIDILGQQTDTKVIEKIILEIVEYKKHHFATEEKYFHLFNFEGTKEHEEQHELFNKKISEINSQYQNDVVQLAFKLVDFLEDWLIVHLMSMDQKYKQCFHEHGLK